MKRIICLSLMLVFLLCGVAQAEIVTKIDDFDNKKTIKSINKKQDIFEGVVLFKVGGNLPMIHFMMMDYKDWYFFKKYIDIKIDEKVYQINESIIDSKMNGDLLITDGAYELSKELQKAIINSKNITVRVYFNNQPTITWKVPDYILEEWKKVLVMK